MSKQMDKLARAIAVYSATKYAEILAKHYTTARPTKHDIIDAAKAFMEFIDGEV